MVTASVAWVRAINTDDLDAMRTLVAEDFVWVDHRQLGWPVSDLEGFLELRRQYADVENRFVKRKVQAHGRVALATTVNRAVGPDGGAVDWVFRTVSTWSADSRLERLETFDEADWDAALRASRS